jgi:hypothetical protein
MECGAYAMNCPVKAIKVSAGVGCAAAIIISMLLYSCRIFTGMYIAITIAFYLQNRNNGKKC